MRVGNQACKLFHSKCSAYDFFIIFENYCRKNDNVLNPKLALGQLSDVEAGPKKTKTSMGLEEGALPRA